VGFSDYLYGLVPDDHHPRQPLPLLLLRLLLLPPLCVLLLLLLLLCCSSSCDYGYCYCCWLASWTRPPSSSTSWNLRYASLLALLAWILGRVHSTGPNSIAHYISALSPNLHQALL
jgi:hypothetical protein